MTWATGRHALFAFILTFALLLINACLLYRTTLSLVENNRRLARSYEVLASLDSVLSTLNEAQAGERGYLLTGDGDFLEPYDRATTRIQDELTRLQAITADNPDDAHRIAVLKEQVAAELDVLSRVIHVRKEAGFAAAQQRVVRGGGRRMEEVRRSAGDIAAVESQVLRDRMELANASTRTALVTLGLSSFMEVAFLGLCGYVVWRNLRSHARVEESLKEADRRKDEFLAGLGHELRNPLAAMLHAVELLRRRGGDHPEAGRVVEVLEWQVRYVSRLVDDLLDVARIDRDKLQLRRESCDLALIVPSAVEVARPLVAARRHKLIVTLSGEPIWLEADPVRLVQVLANLLNNAAKYTEAGGTIWLRAEQQGGEVVVRVRDNGVGIPADMLPRVFDLFTQLDHSRGGAQGGLGIGLALARRLAELHGGGVEAFSDGPGLGSEFVLRLPALAGPPASARAGGELPAAADLTALRRVLIVDDNASAAEMLAALLELKGHEVCVAHDGPAALGSARAYRPDVVLLDIGLPGIDGYEVARRLQEEPAGEGVLLIALTGYGQAEDRRRSREAGFHHHLVKPVDLDALQELLAQPGPG